jgi:hypothetical protein
MREMFDVFGEFIQAFNYLQSLVTGQLYVVLDARENEIDVIPVDKLGTYNHPFSVACNATKFAKREPLDFVFI